MAQVSLTIVKSGTYLLGTPTAKSFNSFWFSQMNATTEVSGANTYIEYFKSGPGGGSYISYWVSETVAEIEALINGASPALTKRTAVAFPSSATIASGDMSKGLFTNTGAVGAVSITLRTATQLATELGANIGSTYDFVVATPVAQAATVVVGSGITAVSDITGGTDLSVSASGAGVFRLTFLSTTAAIISRLA